MYEGSRKIINNREVFIRIDDLESTMLNVMKLYSVFVFPKRQYESKYVLKSDSTKVAEKT